MLIQKEEIQKFSSINASVVSFEQFSNQKAVLESLEAELKQLSSNIETAAVSTIQTKGRTISDVSVKSCFRCGAKHHQGHSCGSRDLSCFKCGKRGHFARCCRTPHTEICNRCGNRSYQPRMWSMEERYAMLAMWQTRTFVQTVQIWRQNFYPFN